MLGKGGKFIKRIHLKLQTLSHRIHGTGIYTNIWLIFLVNVGKYTSPMDPMGFEQETYDGNIWKTLPATTLFTIDF